MQSSRKLIKDISQALSKIIYAISHALVHYITYHNVTQVLSVSYIEHSQRAFTYGVQLSLAAGAIRMTFHIMEDVRGLLSFGGRTGSWSLANVWTMTRVGVFTERKLPSGLCLASKSQLMCNTCYYLMIGRKDSF